MAVPIGDEGHAGAVGREDGIAVIGRPEGELLGGAALDRQAEEVTHHGENQPLAIGRDGDIGPRDLGGFKFNRAPAVVLGCRGTDEEKRDAGDDSESRRLYGSPSLRGAKAVAVDGGDAGVVQAGEHLRFSLEPSEAIRIAGDCLGEDPQGDFVELRMMTRYTCPIPPSPMRAVTS